MAVHAQYSLIILILVLNCSLSLKSKEHDLNITKVYGNYNEVMTFEFNSTIEYVIVFPESNSLYPYRITAWVSSYVSAHLPVIVVVRQEREVLSWQIPFLVDTSKRDERIRFLNTSRTLCHNNMKNIVTKKTNHMLRNAPLNISQNFIVSLSTSSPRKVSVSVIVAEETDFFISLNQRYSIAVSPSEPRYVFYPFPDNKTDTVLVELDSDDDVCLTISVQDSFCPVFDLDKDITYEGKYQTINRKGGLSIRRKDFPQGFFLVFVAKGDNYECSQDNSILPMPRNVKVYTANRTSFVNFQVTKDINGEDYRKASGATVGVIGSFYLFSLIMAFAFTRWGSMGRLKKLRQSRQSIGTVPIPEIGTTPSWTGNLQYVACMVACLPYNIVPMDSHTPISKEQITQLLTSQKLPLRMLAQYPETDKRRSFNYLWHILSIAIFYSIPVVQLVITYQRVVNQTGNQDMCYYNFLCAHPAFGLSDFNHVFSNIGYFFIGILFLLVSIHRHAIIRDRTDLGIPVHYGLFYAMGIALIIEGLLSACYHICPSQSNYQFDTSFMYVMAVLCMVKLYQNRHPDVNATAYATFTVLGIAIFVAMIGILDGTLGVWIAFAVIYTVLSTYISFKIYFLSYIMDGLKNFINDFKTERFKSFLPMRKSRFVVLIIANLVNYSILITGLVLYDSGDSDFGTFLLALLMGNAVLHTIFYTTMKLVHGERICVEAIIYGLLMIASWAGSAIFFLNAATLWTVTPAESRQKNQECILMDFYDTHDVWHLLSAGALYFSFMYLQCLDDDIIDKKQEDIIVF